MGGRDDAGVRVEEGPSWGRGGRPEPDERASGARASRKSHGWLPFSLPASYSAGRNSPSLEADSRLFWAWGLGSGSLGSSAIPPAAPSSACPSCPPPSRSTSRLEPSNPGEGLPGGPRLLTGRRGALNHTPFVTLTSCGKLGPGQPPQPAKGTPKQTAQNAAVSLPGAAGSVHVCARVCMSVRVCTVRACA